MSLPLGSKHQALDLAARCQKGAFEDVSMSRSFIQQYSPLCQVLLWALEQHYKPVEGLSFFYFLSFHHRKGKWVINPQINKHKPGEAREAPRVRLECSGKDAERWCGVDQQERDNPRTEHSRQRERQIYLLESGKEPRMPKGTEGKLCTQSRGSYLKFREGYRIENT